MIELGTFAGDKKVGKNALYTLETKLKNYWVPKIPPYIETYHLTLMTLLWSGGIVLSSYVAQYNIHWLWFASLMIFFQYITDLFDGALGRYRKTGLIRWGYYMDHYLDYVFLCSILIGYSFIVSERFSYMFFFILAIFVAYMVNSFLSFATTNQFQVSYFGVGPTEIRLLFITINTLLIFFGKTYMGQALPIILIISWICLTIIVYRTQKTLWKMDLKDKEKIVHK